MTPLIPSEESSEIFGTDRVYMNNKFYTKNITYTSFLIAICCVRLLLHGKVTLFYEKHLYVFSK